MNAAVIVGLYLCAVISANLIVAALGPVASVVTAFALIGLNITARDRLHDAWSGRGLLPKMVALIAAGSLLSWLVNRDAGPIAFASFVSFAISESADAGVYQKLLPRPWLVRVNGSNAVSAALDSLIFPVLAFGGLMPLITLGQFLAKVSGGALWAFVLRRPAAVALSLILLPAGASSQVSVGVGEFHNEFATQTVVEAVALGPSVLGLTPNLVTSWDLAGGARPFLIPQLGRDLVNHFPVIIGADAGLSAGPWDDYGHWEPHVSVRALAFVTGPLKVVSIMSWQPWNGWARSVVLKADWTLCTC